MREEVDYCREMQKKCVLCMKTLQKLVINVYYFYFKKCTSQGLDKKENSGVGAHTNAWRFFLACKGHKHEKST